MRWKLLAAFTLLLIAGDAQASNDRLDRLFGGAHERFASSDFDILDRPAQQITLETRLLSTNSTALEELGVSPVIRGVTLFTLQPDGTTAVFRTRADAMAGFIYIDSILGEPPATASALSTPVGLGFLYGDQILIDVRMGDTMSYDPTAIQSDDALSEKFQITIEGISESGFGMPVISRRNTPTQVIISNGQSLLIGFEQGLREYREEIDIPLLSDIPLLGSLFLGRVSETERRDLIIHVTPTIVDESETE